MVDAATGEVYWQYIRFTTGTLVTVTLTQQPVSRAAVPPRPSTDPQSDATAERRSVNLTAVRDGYLHDGATRAGCRASRCRCRAVQQWSADGARPP